MPVTSYDGRLSVVVPVRNEAENIAPLIGEIVNAPYSHVTLPYQFVSRSGVAEIL
jgi:glycosyltransferase involved in cell wall biosynthesis